MEIVEGVEVREDFVVWNAHRGQLVVGLLIRQSEAGKWVESAVHLPCTSSSSRSDVVLLLGTAGDDRLEIDLVPELS